MQLQPQPSFEGVTFKIQEIPLDENFKKKYDESVALVSLKFFFFSTPNYNYSHLNSGVKQPTLLV